MDYTPSRPRDPGRHGPRGRSLKDRAEYESKISGKSVRESADKLLANEKTENEKKIKRKRRANS